MCSFVSSSEFWNSFSNFWKNKNKKIKMVFPFYQPYLVETVKVVHHFHKVCFQWRIVNFLLLITSSCLFNSSFLLGFLRTRQATSSLTTVVKQQYPACSSFFAIWLKTSISDINCVISSSTNCFLNVTVPITEPRYFQEFIFTFVSLNSSFSRTCVSDLW